MVSDDIKDNKIKEEYQKKSEEILNIIEKYKRMEDKDEER